MKKMMKILALILTVSMLIVSIMPVTLAEDDHEHEWEEGVCKVCGQRCAHIWENGVCTVCGLPLWVNGICRDCGEEHSHTFVSAAEPCTVCGYICPHASHDRYTLKCNKCGYVVDHVFGEDGVCTTCSYATNVYQYGSVDALYVKDCDQKGQVVQLEYQCTALAGKDAGKEITKKLNVYLPYGYTEEKQYNVFYYLHGAFGTINDIIRPDQVTDTEKMLDNMIAEGVCEPFIFVCPTWFDSDVASGEIDGTLQENFNIQLRDSIIPAVESTYSTYLDCDGKIENVTPEKIAASRDHRAVGGFSGGATVAAMMVGYGQDMFAYYAVNSNSWDPDTLAAYANSEANKNYDVKFYMNTLGTEEGPDREVWVDMYKGLEAKGAPKLIDGTNMTFIRFIGLDHDIVNIRTSIYNAMAVHFFRVASDDTDYSKVSGLSGELTASVADQYGELNFIFTLTEDGNITMDCSAYGGFISYKDEGTYAIGEDGTVTATFTVFWDSMQKVTQEHSDSFPIEKVGTQWVLHYHRDMQGMDKVDASGTLTPVQ